MYTNLCGKNGKSGGRRKETGNERTERLGLHEVWFLANFWTVPKEEGARCTTLPNRVEEEARAYMENVFWDASLRKEKK